MQFEFEHILPVDEYVPKLIDLRDFRTLIFDRAFISGKIIVSVDNPTEGFVLSSDVDMEPDQMYWASMCYEKGLMINLYIKNGEVCRLELEPTKSDVGSRKNFESKHAGYDQTHTILGQEAERARVLLKAARDLLRTCDEGPFVKNALEETVFYDETDCDGACLLEDLEELLETLGDN